MRTFAVIAARCPHYEQRNAVKHADTLKSLLKVGFPPVFTSQQITVKKSFKTGKVNAMILEIACSLGLIPGNHGVVYI